MVTNESGKDLVALFYDVDLLMEPHVDNMLYFHCFWSRDNPTALTEDFELLPKVRGKGRFLGVNIGIRAQKAYGDSWFGEGEVKCYLDGDSKFPTLVGSGTEDYIGTAYGQGPFAHQYQGSPIANGQAGEFAFYRYHIPDPVYFHTDIRVSIQQIGGAMKEQVQDLLQAGVPLQPVSIHNDKGFHKLFEAGEETDLNGADLPDGWTNFYRQDDVSATAYFYLDRPSNELPPLPPVAERIANLE